MATTTATAVAKYFLAKDKSHDLFNLELDCINGINCYRGNVRLNKYLHLSQLLYIAKNGVLLFDDDLYAYANGGVVYTVQTQYRALLNLNNQIEIDEETRDFLDRVYTMLQNASIDDLISISHEDVEWANKHSQANQKMDLLSHADFYKVQYKDALYVLSNVYDYE